ncbi:hypothetical protein CRENBAI_025776 [Crenichthys baileyi]|uniref:EGF-like domain-containing protein n=1 Tax=Crenichthys baileyi TaxID=28760 RepID=A0AAV9SCT4_9TELE
MRQPGNRAGQANRSRPDRSTQPTAARRLLDPIDTCPIPFTGLDVGTWTHPSCLSRFCQRIANLESLRTLPRAPCSAEPLAKTPASIGLVNVRSLANKTFILRDFFSSHGLDFLCMMRLCAQTCENTPGSYRCSCTTGFSLALDGNSCDDVNECDNNPCSQECVNIYGSFQCYCREGYYLKEDRYTCEDIDECSQSIGDLCAFKCINVVGSYRCACPPHGYVSAANGRTCRDIDECRTGTHNCSFSQSCHNLQGSFKCLSFDCPQNYKKVSDTHCERINCPTNSIDCQSSPLRITYHQLNLKTNIITPAQIFRIGPSAVYSGDNIVISIIKGNKEGYFSTRKLNSFTGAIYLQRKVGEPKEFLIDVEMKLLRQGTFTSFLSRIYVFITSSKM